MNPEEYAAQQALISAAVARYVQQFGQLYTNMVLTTSGWVGLLQLLFPEIQRQREQSAALGRVLVDSQRAQHHPELPRVDRDLERYEFEWFARDMEPVRLRMSRADTPSQVVDSLALHAIRAVENGGRRQIINAVEADPAPIVKGWARVATGRETCAWCLMLISRGAVYLEARTAGLKVTDETAQRMIAAGTDVSDDMEQWHTGCDCKAIPVYDRKSWVGKDAADRALDLWGEATKEAIALEDDGLVHKSGKKKGQPFTRNELAINALRRKLNSGEVDIREFAGLAA